MIYWVGANFVVVIHFLFILYILLGGLLVYKWRWTILLHIPCAVWGAWVEYQGVICPLTPLENYWWRIGGEQGYSGGFIEHYLVPLIYIDGLDRELQVILGSVVVVVNLLIYARLVFLMRRSHRPG